MEVFADVEMFDTRSTLFHDPNQLKCYVIHMNNRPDRLANFNKYYKKSDLFSSNILPTLVDAIDGNKLANNNEIQQYVTPRVMKGIMQFQSTGKRTSNEQLVPAMIGCYLSHFKCYEMIRNNNVANAIILEDDAQVNPSILHQIQMIDVKVCEDYDIILLGHICHDCRVLSAQLLRVLDFWGLWGYMISKKGAEKMLSLKDKNVLIDKQIDHLISDMCGKGEFNVYALRTQCVEAGQMGSDLQVIVS